MLASALQSTFRSVATRFPLKTNDNRAIKHRTRYIQRGVAVTVNAIIRDKFNAAQTRSSELRYSITREFIFRRSPQQRGHVAVPSRMKSLKFRRDSLSYTRPKQLGISTLIPQFPAVPPSLLNQDFGD